MLFSNKSHYYQTTHVIIKHLILLSTPQLIILTLHMIPLLSMMQPPLIVAHLVERSLGTLCGLGSSPGQEKFLLAFSVFFKDSDLEFDNRFMAAHIAPREKVFLG